MAIVAGFGALEAPEKKDAVLAAWDTLDHTERFLFNKLITGGLRIGVSQKLMTRALAQATGIEETTLAHRLMGDWTPETTTFDELILTDDGGATLSRPYPFYLAHPVEDVASLGASSDWRAEYKWDGIRGQLILRGGDHFLWSRGEELITDGFPEFSVLSDYVEGNAVIDGEILGWRDGAPLPFNSLQRRIGRKTASKKMRDEAPVILQTYDLLEDNGVDIRKLPYDERRARLAALLSGLPSECPIGLSASVPFKSWDELADIRADARERGVEGVMLKRGTSPYLAGRKRGDWWKWKVEPLTIDAVMIYAQAGHGRRANLYTDFTFAVWSGNELVPFTKAYSGLTDKEFREITAWVRKNTRERFGPVRSVTPEHVFEIAFEGIHKSPRHKSGIALRFPRMLRWRRDKPVQQANTLDDLNEMLGMYG